MNKKINNSRFSIRFCTVMAYHNIHTVGKARRFLKDLNPNTKLCHAMGITRAVYLQNELEKFIQETPKHSV